MLWRSIGLNNPSAARRSEQPFDPLLLRLCSADVYSGFLRFKTSKRASSIGESKLPSCPVKARRGVRKALLPLVVNGGLERAPLVFVSKSAVGTGEALVFSTSKSAPNNIKSAVNFSVSSSNVLVSSGQHPAPSSLVPCSPVSVQGACSSICHESEMRRRACPSDCIPAES
jgi:hypothetical protein